VSLILPAPWEKEDHYKPLPVITELATANISEALVQECPEDPVGGQLPIRLNLLLKSLSRKPNG